MSASTRLLGIFLMLLFTALGFGWGWIMRSIQEKDKKESEEPDVKKA